MEHKPPTPENKERLQKTTVISGFPGIGKSAFIHNSGELKVLDSDSSLFSWKDAEKKERNPEWPQNYIDHIQSNIGTQDAVLVSSHKETRDMLVGAGIPFTLVYPSLEIKEEYIQRYIDRGSNPDFVKLLREKYELWIQELMSQQGCRHVVLEKGQYLSDVMEQIRA